jgi:hypothetical protein
MGSYHQASPHWPDTATHGFVTFTADEAVGTLVVTGRANDTDSEIVAVWDVTASCVNLAEKKLFFYGTGGTRRSEAGRGRGSG